MRSRPRPTREELLAARDKTVPDVIAPDTPAWVLPNPSGLNAHDRLEDLAEKLRELFVAVQKG